MYVSAMATIINCYPTLTKRELVLTGNYRSLNCLPVFMDTSVLNDKVKVTFAEYLLHVKLRGFFGFVFAFIQYCGEKSVDAIFTGNSVLKI